MSNSITIEQYLLAVNQGRSNNAVFVQNTMAAIHKVVATQTFDNVLYQQKTSRGSILSWIQQLSKRTATVLLLLLCAILSGTAYAAYTLWINPDAQVNSVVKQYGHSQALIELRNCYEKDQKMTVEITNGSGGTAKEAAQSIAAQCELQAIQNWAIQALHLQPGNVDFAFTISKVQGDKLTLQDYETHDARAITFSKDIPIVYHGALVSGSTLKPGDTIALITKRDGKNLAAIVKLSYPAALYLSSRVENSYHVRDACGGNGDASCISLPNLDVLRDGEGGANPDTKGQDYEIQGKLISTSPTEFTLAATSGKQYVIHTATDVIGAFNLGNPYGPITIEPGDVLMIRYSQPAGNNPQNIQATQYHAIQLMLQGFNKSAPALSLDNSVKYHYESTAS